MGDQGPNTLLAILGDLPLVVRHEIAQLPEAQQQLSIGEYSKIGIAQIKLIPPTM